MRRVVVTGLGTVTALGPDTNHFWHLLLAGHSGIAASAPWPQAVVERFDGEERFGPRGVAMLDRATQFALVAGAEALAQAGLDHPAQADIDPARCGAIVAASVGHETMEDGYRRFLAPTPDGLPPRLHPFSVPRAMPSAAASQLSMAHGLQGPSFGVASACASGAHAIALAALMVRHGLLDLAVAGGAEAALQPGIVRAWEGLRVLSAEGCRPFSRDRSGLVLGEGAGMLVLEAEDRARRRGATVLATLAGFGLGADAGDITAPSVHGAVRAMQAALHDAGLSPADIDHVNAHGTGTLLNDRSEAQALQTVFGPRAASGLPLAAIKGATGHLLNAAGAVEAVAAVLALRDGIVPPTTGFAERDPQAAVDCAAGTGRAARITAVLSNSFAFGGLNAVLVLRRAD
jgi:nodulation protein E